MDKIAGLAAGAALLVAAGIAGAGGLFVAKPHLSFASASLFKIHLQ